VTGCKENVFNGVFSMGCLWWEGKEQLEGFVKSFARIGQITLEKEDIFLYL
jgi:hypothetical protein